MLYTLNLHNITCNITQLKRNQNRKINPSKTLVLGDLWAQFSLLPTGAAVGSGTPGAVCPPWAVPMSFRNAQSQLVYL